MNIRIEDDNAIFTCFLYASRDPFEIICVLRFNVIHILKCKVRYNDIFKVWLFFVPLCPQNDPHWNLQAYTKRPLQHVFLNAPDIRRQHGGTL